MRFSQINIDAYLTTAAKRFDACALACIRLRDAIRRANGDEAARAAIEINEHVEVAHAAMRQVATVIARDCQEISVSQKGATIQ